MTSSRLFRCAATLLLLVTCTLTAAPAQAAGVDQVCVGTEVTTFDPPLTLTARPTTITVSGLYPTCTSPAAVTAGYAETFPLTASCLVLFDSGSASRTFTWGGTTAPSTFEYNVTSSAVAGQVVVTNTGVITAGGFAPAGAKQVITLVTPNLLQCLTGGVPSVTGPTTLTVHSA
ncbi:hypothetical protein ABZ816_26360 [Actinosynnema sp. NPDC047251]|uniref:Putative secreted protein n=1 Tax=Saccharothrix espanaensis (strain ATCC 51144 / DSM 44229 / JCM 9112 / NBRC 15066 / NRRL 15764) TaxID=1179773 RepID=K0JWB1_SACES|nr:hypothetical protein [Saccharothrix espanaensis]CCH32085.1 putative secreted protein [Saccharothrix espanaensis DSM 44229]